MKQFARILLILIPALCLTGCIMLPIPHDEWLSPKFSGVVRDAETGAPLAGVKVTLSDYRRSENEIGAIATRSDEKGRFTVVVSRRATWLPIWLGPAEGTQQGKVLFELEGYAPVEETRSQFSGASAKITFELAIQMKRQTANQALQHNDPSCHVSCLRTPRASRGRG
jgi:hypothetical protein